MGHTKNLGRPDETVELEGIREDAVEIGDFTVARVVAQPGWRWSLHMKSGRGHRVVRGPPCRLAAVRSARVSSCATASPSRSSPTTSLTSRRATTATRSGTSRRSRSNGPASGPGRGPSGWSAIASSWPSSSPTSWTPRRPRAGSVTAPGESCSRRTTRASAPRSIAIEVERSTRPVTACWRRSTAPLERSDVPLTSATARHEPTSTSAPACTSARSRWSAPVCVAKPSTRRRGSWPWLAPTRSSSPRRRERWHRAPDSPSRTAVSTCSRASTGSRRLYSLVG